MLESVGILETVIGTFLSGMQVATPFIQDSRKLAENVKVINVDKITQYASVIMSNRGYSINGFKDDVYFSRKYNSYESLDEHLLNLVRNKSFVVITGMCGAGKSRLVYELLKSGKSPFIRVVTLSQTNLSCSMKEIEKIIVRKANSETLIYIDNLHNLKDSDGEVGWSKLADIFKQVSQKKGKIIISCLEKPQGSDMQYLSDFQKEIEYMQIPDVDNPTYELCRSQFRQKRFSPIIGNYVDGMNNFVRINEKFPMSEAETVVLSVYLFITHYFGEKDYLFIRDAYLKICDEEKMASRFSYLGNEQAGREYARMLNNEDLFKNALKRLLDKHILKVQNNFYILHDEIYAYSFAHSICEVRYDTNKKQSDKFWMLELYCTTLLAERSQLLYPQEEWSADTIIDINPELPDFYIRVITRASKSNERRIAEYVKKRFDRQFFECEFNKEQGQIKVIKLKEKYKEDKITGAINQTIGVILSRTYYPWKKYIEDYQQANVKIDSDTHVLSELLRIAGDARSNEDVKEEIKEYIKQNFHIDSNKLISLANSSERIAINFEMANSTIDAQRIENAVSLFLKNINDKLEQYELVNEEYKITKDQLLKIQRDEIIKQLQLTERSLISWSRIIASKINTINKLFELTSILEKIELGKLSECLEKRVYPKIYPLSNSKRYVFFSPIAMSVIAGNIHRNHPLSYLDEYMDVLNYINTKMRDQKYKYIFNRDSLIGFACGQDKKSNNAGALEEVESVSDAEKIINFLREKKILRDEIFFTDLLYATCLYRMFAKINNVSIDKKESEQETERTLNFHKAKHFLDSLCENQSVEFSGSKLKFYNDLLRKAPWQCAIEIMDTDFMQKEGDIYSINSFFSCAREEFLTVVGTLKWKKEADEISKQKIDDIIFQILEKNQIAERNKCVFDELTYGALNAFFPEYRNITTPNEEFEKLWKSLILQIEESTNKIVNSQKRAREKLVDKEQYLDNIDAYFYEGKYSEDGRLCDSDQILHLIRSSNKLYKKIGARQIFMKKDKMTVHQNIARKINEMTLNTEHSKPTTVDGFFPPKLYFYEEISKRLPKNANVEQRWELIRRALVRLVESDNNIIERSEELQRKNKSPYNIVEKNIALCNFDDAILIVERVKEMAKANVYRDVYRPLTIKMICNKIKMDLTPEDVDVVKKRIERLNKLISDPELILSYDVNFSKLISNTNSRLRKQKNDDVFFPALENYVNINLPISSEDVIARHITWDMYEEQSYIGDLPEFSIHSFAYREMEGVVESINNRNDANLTYLFKVMLELQKRELSFSNIKIAYEKSFSRFAKTKMIPRNQYPDLFEFIYVGLKSEDEYQTYNKLREYYKNSSL